MNQVRMEPDRDGRIEEEVQNEVAENGIDPRGECYCIMKESVSIPPPAKR